MAYKHITELYVYFLLGGKEGRQAFNKFYNMDDSRQFVRNYASRYGKFWTEYMKRYLSEVREQFINSQQNPFRGVITPRGKF